MKNIFKKIWYFLHPGYEIRLGIDKSGDEEKYCTVALGQGRGPVVLYSGRRIPLWALLFRPVPVYSSLSAEPVLFVTERLDKDDPDTWLDRNEERIFPAGFSSEEIINETDVEQDTIYSASADRVLIESRLEELHEKGFICAALYSPLWQLARIYSERIEGDFVIWKITEKGSVIGKVENGRVSNLCTLWPDNEDLLSDTQNTVSAVKHVAESLTDKKECGIVCVSSDDKIRDKMNSIEMTGYKIIDVPEIDSIEKEYHEAFAASTGSNGCDFSTLRDRLTSSDIVSRRSRALKVVTALSGVVFLSLLLILGASAAITYTCKRKDKLMGPVRQKISILDNKTETRDSLKQIITDRSGFAAGESMTAYLTGEFQAIFPQQVWAEQISISEKQLHGYRVDILALSRSTALVPKLMKNLKGLKGIENLRMIYSEQIEDKKMGHITRVKIQAEWDQNRAVESVREDKKGQDK